MCYIGPYSTYSTFSKEPWKSGCSVGCLVRYCTYSTYSKEPGKSGCSVGCLVRYSTQSTCSKDAGDCESSAGWRSVRAAFCMVFAWFLHDMWNSLCFLPGFAWFLHDMWIQAMSSFAKGNPFSLFFGDPFFWDPLFSFFSFFLSPARLARLKCGVSILQPHACTQRFRL